MCGVDASAVCGVLAYFGIVYKRHAVKVFFIFLRFGLVFWGVFWLTLGMNKLARDLAPVDNLSTSWVALIRKNELMSLETYRLETILTNLAGGRSVYRGDVLGGVLINYYNTTDYVLETRVTRDGRCVFMINKSSYAKASDIPLTFRKARRVAGAIEANIDLLISGIRGVN